MRLAFVTGALAVAVLLVLARRGRRGTRLVRLILEHYGPTHRPTASDVETLFLELVLDRGLPEPERQAPIVGPRGWIGTVDFAWRSVLLVVEVDSSWHDGPYDEEVDAAAADQLMKDLRARLSALPGQRIGKFEIASADDFAYHDPVDGSDSKNQGIRILLKGGSRLVYRLSGTGTAGATLRIYLERFEPRPEHHGEETQAALADLIALSTSLPDIRGRLGRDKPSVVT